MLCIVPSTLLVCVQATSVVLSDSNGRRLSAVRVKPLEGVHHLTVRPRALAARSHGEMLASWSMEEMMISEFGGNSRA